MSRRVVMVDDVDVHFKVIKEIASVQAYAFSSTALALAVSRSVMPELFIVNHRPPRIDGARFVADLRADADLAGVPVLLLASEADRRTCYEALDHGADDFLLSPVDRHELRRRVMRVLAIEEARTRAGLLPVAEPLMAEPLMIEPAALQPSSMSRLAVTTGIDDAAFVARVIREAAQSLGDEVPFSGALLRLDQNAWVVENAYRPDGAAACLPDAGTRVELDDVTVCEVLRTGTTLVVRDSRSDERFRERSAPWRTLLARPVKCGATVYVILLAAADVAARAFDPNLIAYVDTLAAMCATRLQQRDQLARLRYQNDHDALTGLLNRSAFRERGASALRVSAHTAIAVVDIDNFHELNDALGSAAGDRLITAVAAALRAHAEGDIIGRLGGDAFGIVMRDVVDREDAERRVAAYADRITAPFAFDETATAQPVTASIGVALAPEDGEAFEHVLARADAAMHGAKDSGRSRWAFFDASLDGRSVNAWRLRTQLLAALATDELHLDFQPTVDLTTGRIVGAEALVRWNHPERGMLAPVQFIGFAEEHGMLPALGAWVMRRALEASAWARRIDPDLRIWFNLAPSELADPQLLARIAEHGSLHGIGVEITEGGAIRDVAATQRALAALKAAGARIALDDFGTGQSSLSQLKRLPVDVVKLDRAFTADLPGDEYDREIIDAVLGIGQRFGFATLAEGIETPAQARWLRDAGCRYGQGFLFGRPMPLDQLLTTVRARIASQPLPAASLRALAG